MKKRNILFGFIVLAAVIELIGCAGLDIFLGGTETGVTLRTDGNLSTVRAGGTLRFSASGQGITWAVSSTNDGSGSVGNGTYIDSSGMLTVAANETLSILYVIATSNSGQSAYKQIRVTTVTNITINPSNQPVTRGKTLQLNASITGNNNPDTAVTWKVSSNSAGTGAVTPGTGINNNGLLTVSSNETLTTLYIFATSVVDPSKSRSISVAVVIPTVTGVTVSPSNQPVPKGSTLQFSALIAGTNNPNTAVTWKVSSNAAGTGAVTAGTGINNNGLLTIAPGETTAVLYVFADSVEDPTKSGSVIVTVIAPTVTSVTVSPSNQSVAAGKTLQFRAAIAGTSGISNAVTWSVSSNVAGTGAVTPGTSINNNGLLTVSANETATTLFVIATSAADSSKSGSVPVTVTAPPVVTPPTVTTPPVVTPPVVTDPPTVTTPPAVTTPTVSGVTVTPSSYATKTNTTVQLNAAVAGANNPSTAVTWKVSSNAAGTGAVAPRTTVSSSGLLTVAPNEWSPTLYVFATSVADPTKTGSATVTITNNNENQGSNRGN